MTDVDARDHVGPVLQKGAQADAIITAIKRHNQDVLVLDRGAYLRVSVPQRCVLLRAAVEASLQAAFELPSDLELVMPAFAGKLSMSREEAVWSFGT